MSSVTYQRLGAIDKEQRETRGLSIRNLRTLRWLSLILPVVLLIGADYLRHFVVPFVLFHDWPGFVIIWGCTALGTFCFSKIVFGTIERMQREILKRNADLSSLHDAAHHQAEQLKALHEANMAVTAEISLEAVLQKVVDLSRQLVGAQFAALAVSGKGETGRLITSGLAPDDKARITAIRTDQGVMAAVPDGKPLRLADVRQHPSFRGFPPNHPEMLTFLGVPIVFKGQVFGNLRLTNKAGGRYFTQQDEDIVAMLAAHAAIAIQNAKVHEQEQALAVLEDRERIAQELHDGIIQDIYAIGLGLEQCIEQVDANSPCHRRLAKSVDNLNDIIKDIRNYIFALEPTDLQGHDLAAGLDNMAQEFRVNSLIDVELVLQGDVNVGLVSDQVGQMLQIAHEALTNVLKHARASAVRIQATRLADQLELTICDNGRGFDVSKAARNGLGLRNIAERTRVLGGCFSIESQANDGAKLTAIIPMRA